MRGAREHFESRNLASFAEFSVSKIEFKKLSSAFEAESFEKSTVGRTLNAEKINGKIYIRSGVHPKKSKRRNHRNLRWKWRLSKEDR